MSKDKPIRSYLYICDGDLMRCEDYEWGHVNTRVGKVSKTSSTAAPACAERHS
jgi:hypothetical protein